MVVWTCECLAYFVNFYNVSVKQLRYGVVVWVRLSQGGCHLIAIFFNCLHLEFIDSLVHFRHPHDRKLFALVALRSCSFHLCEVQCHDIGVWVCLFVA